jgi:hypothetical protein
VPAQVVKKGDVASLLDSAGFSRSNPYYIVAQGKVQALTRMSDVDRLNVRLRGCIDRAAEQGTGRGRGAGCAKGSCGIGETKTHSEDDNAVATRTSAVVFVLASHSACPLLATRRTNPSRLSCRACTDPPQPLTLPPPIQETLNHPLPFPLPASHFPLPTSPLLQLLKEVAGTQVYEERRRESLSILEDTDGKRRGIDEVSEGKGVRGAREAPATQGCEDKGL